MSMITDELKKRIEECNDEITIKGNELAEIESFYKERRDRFDRFVALRTNLVTAYELEHKEVQDETVNSNNPAIKK